VDGGAIARVAGGGTIAANCGGAGSAGGNALIAWIVVSIFSVNGLNNFDNDCYAVISPTRSSIESCIMFLRVLSNSCTKKSRFAGSVILRNDMSFIERILT
jgi:hypothetical protein